MIKDSGFGFKITKILGFRLKKNQSRLVSFISKSPYERVKDLSIEESQKK